MGGAVMLSTMARRAMLRHTSSGLRRACILSPSSVPLTLRSLPDHRRLFSTEKGPEDELAALVEHTAFPGVTNDFVTRIGAEDAEVVWEHVQSQDSPADALMALARAWADPDSMEERLN